MHSRRKEVGHFVLLRAAILNASVPLLLTGGSEWTLEDMIHLKNVEIPSTACNGYVNGDLSSPYGITVTDTSQDVAPSARSKFHVRRMVQLGWVSTEDGGHVLTVGVGSCIRLYAAVPGDVAMTLQSPGERMPARAAQPSRGVLQKSKSMAVHSNAEAAAAACERRWVQIRTVDLTTADGRPPMPLNISWVRSGILVVGLDTEMHVYSQWRGPSVADDILPSSTAVTAATTAAQATSPLPPSTSFLQTPGSGLPKSVSSMKRDASIASLSLLAEKDRRRGASATRSSISAENSSAMKKSESVDSFRVAIRDCGLFEAARRASPCLPQYHPRQLIELLNFGKIRRVKAILAHLLRCIAGSATGGDAVDTSLLTTDATGTAGPLDDRSPTYVEISSIPALPLYALLAADTAHEVDHKVGGGASRNATDHRNADYTTLFTTDTNADDALDDQLEEMETAAGSRGPAAAESSLAASAANKLEFTPAQAHLLVRHLTHTQLPGLSSLDQMYLLAVAETVANTKVDFRSSGFTASAGGYSLFFENIFVVIFYYYIILLLYIIIPDFRVCPVILEVMKIHKMKATLNTVEFGTSIVRMLFVTLQYVDSVGWGTERESGI